MLKIGDFSKLSRMSIRMLRHYDEIGLLVPGDTDPFTGYRYYGADQLPIAGRIAALREMGFGLAAVGEILKSYEEPERLAAFLEIRRAELLAEAEETERRRVLLESTINRLRKDERTMYDVTLKSLPSRTVASVRMVIPNYQAEGAVWQALGEEMGAQRVQPVSPAYPIAIFHDKEYVESGVDVEVQLAVASFGTNTGRLIFKVEPQVEYASATYKGGYEQLAAVNAAVGSWVEENGYTFVGAAFNINHVSPGTTQNPAEYVTEVCYPVVKR